jgi:transposase
MEKLEVLKFHVGIDISKSKFDAAIGVINYNQKTKFIASHEFINSKEGYLELLKWANKKTNPEYPISYSMEATGVYYEKLAYFLNDKGFQIHVLVPSQAKKYIQSIGVKTKTDKIDAKSLMQLGLERNLKTWIAPKHYFYQLRILTRERESILTERTQLLNQKHALESGFEQNAKTLQRINKRIEIITDFVKEVEFDIKNVINQNKELSKKVTQIITIPGVGLITVATILAETHGFNLILNSRQLTSYAGYDVVVQDSGQHKSRGRISKKGNRHIRKAMHLPALAARKSNPNYKDFYDKIYNKNPIKMVGCVALQRKLLCLIYTLWKRNEEFKHAINSGNHELKTSFGCCEAKKSSATKNIALH